MANSSKYGADENTFIKAYEDLERSSRPAIRERGSYPLLEIVHGLQIGSWFGFGGQKELTIGRALNNHITLEDNSVSRSHALIQIMSSGYLLKDLGSRNGTFLNGHKIQGEAPLRHGDVVKVGIYTFRFLEEPTDEAFRFEEKEEYTPRVDVGPHVSYASPPDEAERFASTYSPDLQAAAAGSVSSLPAQEISSQNAQPVTAVAASTVSQSTSRRVLPRKKSKLLPWLFTLALLCLLVGGGGYAAYRFGVFKKLKARLNLSRSPRITAQTTPPVSVPTPPVVTPVVPSAEGVTAFLEVDAKPLSAKIIYQGKELGRTPFKTNIQVPITTPQELSAEYTLEEIGETWTETQSFQIQKPEELVSIQFDAPLGRLLVAALPKEGQVSLEGQYQGQEKLKTISLARLSFGKPVYLPYGRYVFEIRQETSLDGGDAKVKRTKFRRTFDLTREAPEFTLQVTEESLRVFSAKIESDPAGAEVWLDGKSLGTTPFDGDLPVGRHDLLLKKEGFNEFEREINIEFNVPYEVKFNLNSSPVGEKIRAGEKFFKTGKYNEALEELAEALKQSPDAADLARIHLLLGQTFLKTQTYDQALAYLEKAKENPDQSLQAELGMVEAYVGLGQNDKSLNSLISLVLNTSDSKTRSHAEALYHKMYPMRSLLYVASEPPGAKISLNGTAIDQMTPVIFPDLMVGAYRVTIEKEGFQTYETRVTMPLSAIKPLIVQLVPQP